MKFIDNGEKWAKWVEDNPDSYGGAVLSYAKRWAELMEANAPEGIPTADWLKENADNYSHKADVEGITGFMHGCAVSTLADCWLYGETLRRWHNKSVQFGTEGDEANEHGGVLNPAVINIASRKP